MKTKNILNKFVFVFLLTFNFSVSTVTAQNDTLYVMKNGNVLGKYNVNTEVDSVIFYQLEIQPGDTMYVMKNGNVQGKYNLNTEVDSVIFYQHVIQPGTNPVETINVQVTLPEGANYSLTGSKVMSYSTWSDVDAGGKSKAAHSKQSISIAYVFDKNDKLILAGFISDSSRVISPASTAKVLLYWAHRIQIQPFELTESYLKLVDQITGAMEWVDEYEKIFISDPMTLSNGSYVAALKNRIEKMTARNSIDIYNLKSAASDITVDGGDIRSGLQLAEDGLSKFSVTNYYRRRGHAFVYKMSFKDQNGDSHKVKDRIEKSTKSEQDFIVDPTAGVTSVLGEVGKKIEGTDIESAAKKSDPVALDLADNETEAEYKVRIVGPGFSYTEITEVENSKLFRLEMETFALDVVIPAISIIMSLPDTKDAPPSPASAKEKIIEKLITLMGSFPDVYDEIKKGNYENAQIKLFENLYKAEQAANLADLAGIVLDYRGISDDNALFYNAKIKNLIAIMSIFDAVLGATDIARILKDVAASKSMEEWRVIARSSQVKLLPKESTVVTFTQQKITAEVKNLDESGDVHPFFEWSTSGKYGTISDTKGHTGTSFASADKDIFYYSKAKSTDLSDGDNIEYIYVKAFLENKLIGADTAKVNVKKYKYEMKPEGVTLTGKEGDANEVALYLEIPKGGIPIQPNNDIDFKVVWSTAGKYGGLYGEDIDNVSTMTTYDDNKAWYDCTDKDTKEGTETIYARIYSKSKEESNYSLFDEVKGTVKINNDPKKKIFIVPVTYTTKILTPGVGNWAAYPTVQFAVEDSAKSYQVRLFHFTGTWGNVLEGKVYAWDAGKLPKTPYNIYPETLDINGGQYYMVFDRTWCGGACDASITNEWIAKYKEGMGSPLTEVTITFK